MIGKCLKLALNERAFIISGTEGLKIVRIKEEDNEYGGESHFYRMELAGHNFNIPEGQMQEEEQNQFIENNDDEVVEEERGGVEAEEEEGFDPDDEDEEVDEQNLGYRDGIRDMAIFGDYGEYVASITKSEKKLKVFQVGFNIQNKPYGVLLDETFVIGNSALHELNNFGEFGHSIAASGSLIAVELKVWSGGSHASTISFYELYGNKLRFRFNLKMPDSRFHYFRCFDFANLRPKKTDMMILTGAEYPEYAVVAPRIFSIFLKFKNRKLKFYKIEARRLENCRKFSKWDVHPNGNYCFDVERNIFRILYE